MYGHHGSRTVDRREDGSATQRAQVFRFTYIKARAMSWPTTLRECIDLR